MKTSTVHQNCKLADLLFKTLWHICILMLSCYYMSKQYSIQKKKTKRIAEPTYSSAYYISLTHNRVK